MKASDPTTVVARSEVPVLATKGVPWMEGAPGLYCNDPHVVFMQSPPQPVSGKPNVFRLYFGMGGSCKWPLADLVSCVRIPLRRLKSSLPTDVGTAKVEVSAE